MLIAYSSVYNVCVIVFVLKHIKKVFLISLLLIVSFFYLSNKSIASITFQTPGAIAYSASGGTTVSPAYPSPVSANDLLVLIVGMKPSTANSGSVTTPPGWTADGSLTGAGGYGTTLDRDTGNTNIFAFYRVATGTETGSLSVAIATNNVSWAQIYRFTNATGSWSVAGATGSDTTAGNVSITMSANPGVTAGDYILGAMVIPTDVTTPSQFSSEALSQTGVTFSTPVEISEPDTNAGNDIGGVTYYATATAGTASGAPTFTATAGGNTTNVRGPGIFIRIREANTAPSLSISQPDGIGDTVTVGASYNITYTLTDPDPYHAVTTSFYYDTDATGLNGTAISGACASAPEGTGATCSWNTTGMTPGNYYIYGLTSDGIAPQVSAYSPGVITINPVASVPTLSSPTATSITITGATLGANVTSLGFPASISARGTCFGLSPSPTTNCLAEGGTSTGVFTHARTGMSPNTLYYYRGYATNVTGTGYSTDGTFTTSNITATISASTSSCVILSGGSTCTIPFTWSISGATSPNLFNATTANTYSTSTSGTNVSFPITNGLNTVQVRDSNTVLNSTTVTGNCEAGTAWTGSACATNTFAITASSGANGNVAPSGTTNVLQGGSQVYTITPDSGYYIATLVVDSVSIATSTTYTFTNVQATHTISATFELIPPPVGSFTIIANQNPNGTLSPSGSTIVTQGGSLTYTITPNGGYDVGSLIIDSFPLSSTSTTYTFTNVNANHTIEATFTALTVAEPLISAIRKLASIVFTGKAFPGGKISIIRKEIGADFASSYQETTREDGSFSVRFEDLPTGAHNFGLLIKDLDGRTSQTKFFLYDTDRGIEIFKNIVAPPTIDILSGQVSRGGNVKIFGYASPSHTIRIYLNDILYKEVLAGRGGVYSFSIPTSALDFGQYRVRTKQINLDGGTESDFSTERTFVVSKLAVAKADFSGDGKIDIKDWSIFLARFTSKNSELRGSIDLSGDGKTDLSDFSIFIKTLRKK